MKLKIKACISLIFMLCMAGTIYAQSIKINGKVVNKTSGQPLSGATVKVVGTDIATQTDKNGDYTILVPQKGNRISVSYVGFRKSEKEIKGSGTVDFFLETDAVGDLSEVVVVGYGTQKLQNLTGAISAVNSKVIEELAPIRIEDALQGTASGVTMIGNGSPGAKPTLFIRGIPDYAGNDPSIIIDGVQQTINDLNAINPSDIESINVLKDAAATAVYGVKGGNGVILVTTKSGKKNQKTEFGFNAYYGMQQVLRTLPVLNATEYGAMLNEGSMASGGGLIFSDLSKLGQGTNWQNQIFKETPIQNYSLTAKGGGDKTTYFLSGNYISQGGIVGGYDKSRFNRANFTANVSTELTTKLKFILNANYFNFYSKAVPENAFNSILGAAINFDPTVSIDNTVPNTIGKYGFSTLILRDVFNPLTVLENTYNENKSNKWYGKIELQYEVIKDLKITGRLGFTQYNGLSKTFYPLVFYGLNNTGNSLNADGSTVTGKHNSVAQEKATHNITDFNLFANYNFKWKTDHSMELMAGIELNKNAGNVAGASRQDVPYNSWNFADFTAATGSTSNNNANGLTGYYYQYFNNHASGFARINYDYKGIYLASVTGRRDGSYAFGANNKFGNFYAGSVGWIMSKENFFKISFINFLKLRASYGSTGSDNNLDPKNVLALIQTDYANSLYANGNSIGYTYGNVFNTGATLRTYANPNIKWQVTKQTDIGLDMNFFNNKFSLTVDYYIKKTSGLLFAVQPSLYLGAMPGAVQNFGSSKTNGVDINLGFKDTLSKNLKLNTSIVFSTFKSTVLVTDEQGTGILGGYYDNGQKQSVTVFAPTYSPASFIGYKAIGIFQTAAEIASSPTQSGAQPGDVKFADINGDGKITAADRTLIGNPFPKYTIGWNIRLEYKNLDFSIFTYASIGNDVYQAFERNDNYTNKYRAILDRWTGPNSTNDPKNPRYSFTDPNNNSRVSDRYVEDGSFVKIRSLMLGYTFPKNLLKNTFKSIRLYIQAKNLLTLTRYDGLDPEVVSTGLMDTGVDRGIYPQARTFLVGLDIKL